VDRVKPSVVSISVEVTQTDFLGRQTRGTAAGSGFIFDSRGYILTNNHVVENATHILLTMDDTRRFEAELVGRDPLTDLAVIKFTEDMEVPALPLADSDELRIGEWVVAIGNALGLPGEPTVTVGVVGAKSRTVGPLASGIYLHNMLQTDAAINPGNSGGPLINLNGRVVGINSAIIEGANGIGFSIAANTAKAVAEQLVEHGKVVWPWLGISANDVTPQVAVEYDLAISEGVLVLGIEPGGPADKAGMLVEDVILSLAGKAIPDTIALQRATRQNEIGATVEVAVLRDGREVKLSVTLEEMPRPQ
jgi:S1-C subfamily serine protease